MSSELGQEEAQDFRTATADDSQGWGKDTSTGIPWRTSQGGTSPDPDGFPVEWQLSPDDDDETTSARQVSRDEEARMFQRRLLRLYRVYYPPPERT
jgi:hypothetical protein